MPAEKIYDLYITDRDRNIILEKRSINVRAAEKIIRDYPWRDEPQSHAQVWKPYSKLSFSINYVEATEQFRVGFSEKASMFKLPMPYVGASYGYLNGIDDVIKALNLFFEGELDKLEQLLKKYRCEGRSKCEACDGLKP